MIITSIIVRLRLLNGQGQGLIGLGLEAGTEAETETEIGIDPQPISQEQIERVQEEPDLPTDQGPELTGPEPGPLDQKTTLTITEETTPKLTSLTFQTAKLIRINLKIRN